MAKEKLKTELAETTSVFELGVEKIPRNSSIYISFAFGHLQDNPELSPEEVDAGVMEDLENMWQDQVKKLGEDPTEAQVAETKKTFLAEQLAQYSRQEIVDVVGEWIEKAKDSEYKASLDLYRSKLLELVDLEEASEVLTTSSENIVEVEKSEIKIPKKSRLHAQATYLWYTNEGLQSQFNSPFDLAQDLYRRMQRGEAEAFKMADWPKDGGLAVLVNERSTAFMQDFSKTWEARAKISGDTNFIQAVFDASEYLEEGQQDFAHKTGYGKIEPASGAVQTGEDSGEEELPPRYVKPDKPWKAGGVFGGGNTGAEVSLSENTGAGADVLVGVDQATVASFLGVKKGVNTAGGKSGIEPASEIKIDFEVFRFDRSKLPTELWLSIPKADGRQTELKIHLPEFAKSAEEQDIVKVEQAIKNVLEQNRGHFLPKFFVSEGNLQIAFGASGRQADLKVVTELSETELAGLTKASRQDVSEYFKLRTEKWGELSSTEQVKRSAFEQIIRRARVKSFNKNRETTFVNRVWDLAVEKEWTRLLGQERVEQLQNGSRNILNKVETGKVYEQGSATALRWEEPIRAEKKVSAKSFADAWKDKILELAEDWVKLNTEANSAGISNPEAVRALAEEILEDGRLNLFLSICRQGVSSLRERISKAYKVETGTWKKSQLLLFELEQLKKGTSKLDYRGSVKSTVTDSRSSEADVRVSFRQEVADIGKQERLAKVKRQNQARLANSTNAMDSLSEVEFGQTVDDLLANFNS